MAPPPNLDHYVQFAQQQLQSGDLAGADATCRAILQHDPKHPVAFTFLGIIAGQVGDYGAAATCFEQALQRDRNNASLHFNLGEAYRYQGKFERAWDAYRRATAIEPNLLAAHVNCAEAAKAAADKAASEGAEAAARKWRRAAARELGIVGLIHTSGQQGQAAEAAYRDALALDPSNTEIEGHLGDLLQLQGRLSEAEAVYREALIADPRAAKCWNNLGTAQMEQGRWDEAEQAFRQALKIDPHFHEAASNLTHGKLLNLCYRTEVTAEELFEAHRQWGLEVMAKTRRLTPPFANSREPDRRLRIGYVSPDMRQHSVSYFFESLLAGHDRSRFEVYLYAEVEKPDAVSERLKGYAAAWRSTVGLNDLKLQQRIRDDRIDILIDLAGHTNGTRLNAFTPKPAPVTMNWQGYPATTGLPTVDYRIVDAWTDPPGKSDELNTERLIRLPNGFHCYHVPTGWPAVSDTPALSKGFVTFGSFNNPTKLTDQVLETWATILAGLPNSRLLLKGKSLADPAQVARVQDIFAEQGVSADRLDLKAMIPSMAEHVALYREIDIGLDPFPYNGTTTTCEAFWMGVPVVTLVGDRHTSRVGLSLLSQLRLGHLALPDRESYIRQALALASDLPALNTLRLGMRQRMALSSLCDRTAFAAKFEAALREAWTLWCQSGA